MKKYLTQSHTDRGCPNRDWNSVLIAVTALALNIALNSRRLNLSYLSEALSLGMETLCMHVLPWAVEVHSFFGFHCWVPRQGKLICQDEKVGLILMEIRSLQRLRQHISRFSSIFIMNSGPLKKAMELCHSPHPYFHKH